MPTFDYKAVTSTGENIKGSEKADSHQEMIQRLRDRQQFPVEVQEVPDTSRPPLQLFGRVTTKHIAVFCRQFYTMLNAGVTIVTILEILREQVTHKKMNQVIADLYRDVQTGLTFSESMEKQGRIFPDLMIYTVAAGEASGSLDVVMGRMADHYEKEHKVNNKIKNAMVYPIILSIVALAVVIFLLVVVMPTFIGMFQQSGVQLPLPTRILLAISDTIRDYWYLVAGFFALMFFALRRVLTSPQGIRWVDRLKFKLPLIRSLTPKIVASRFSRTLSTLMVSGIPLMQALENTANAVGNRVVQEGLMSIRDEVRQGSTLSGPIKKLGYFPPMVDNMIKIGEESGTLDDILERTATFFDEEVETEIQRLLTLLEPMMIVLMAVIIGFIVISMVLPMFDMMQTVQ